MLLRIARAVAQGLLIAGLFAAAPIVAQTVSQSAPRTDTQGDPPSPNYPAKQKPLLSLDSLSFLEGTWEAGSRDGKTDMGTYSFARQLNRHLLARMGPGDKPCPPGTGWKSPVCAQNDLFYVFQDSAGAPLKAIYFDGEGHVIRYTVDITHSEVARTRQDLVVFSSDLADFGPRFRLVYERTTDTLSGRASMKGSFETLLGNGEWHPYVEWVGPQR